MKRLFLFMTILLIYSSGFAYTSIAATDNFMAAKVNPAALSVGNAGGVTYLQNYDEDGLFEDWYSIMINTDKFAYILDQMGNNNYHKIALSSNNPMFAPNLYSGTAWDWKNKHFKKGHLSQSFLYRPANFLSLATVINNLFEKNNVNFNLGAAVRPIMFSESFLNRITFSADTNYDYDDSDWKKPVVGIQTELVDGIQLGGAYDMESETFNANFGITFENLGIGSLIDADKDKEFTHGKYYINISENTYRSFIGKEKKYFVDYELKGKILEKRQGSKFGPITVYMGKEKTLSQIIEDIQKYKEDDNVTGLVFKSGNISASFAKIAELKNALLDFKTSGKYIVFYYEMITGANYTLAASVADEIYLNPLGMIDLKGLSISAPYIKNLLDTLGVDVVNFRSHDYKTAGNILSEEHMTEAERETYEYLLEGIYEEMTTMIVQGRGDKLAKPIDEIIDNGPYWKAEESKDIGLVDKIIFEDELEKAVKEKYAAKKIVDKYEKEAITYDWHKDLKDKVALIYAIGNIHSGKGISGKSIGSETTAELIKKAREDKRIKGIIIRVDSGGGSALASDIIAREVELCKSGKNKKPVIISMSGVAGSGGYYIATLADEIIAQPATITGSIGVVGIFPCLERLYSKILINWDTVKKGEHANFGKTNRRMTEDEKQLVRDGIIHFYDRFISTVARGRDMDEDDVHKIAQGRVWTGKQAFERGLIDALGGMDVAVSEMKKLANLEREVELIEFEQDKSSLTLNLGMAMKSTSPHIPEGLRSVYELGEKLLQFEDENILMILPVEPEFK